MRLALGRVSWLMFVWVVGLAGVGVRAATPPAPPLTVGRASEEALGPFQSWANVRSGYGAVGDGVADDTKALQRAIYDLGEKGEATVLYLPAGRYRITKTLLFEAKRGISIIGEDPANTSIVWGGESGGTMMLVNGAAFSQLTRITWNGSSKAGIGVAQWWNHKQNKQWASGIRYVDSVFTDLGTGIAGGRRDTPAYGQMDSEVTVLRSRFVRNTLAGISVGSFNALDWWVWDSEFIDCARGVTNDANPVQPDGAGNFMVYRSVFKGSTVADVSIGNTGWFSLHNNVSVGSQRFLQARDVGANTAAMIVQNNRVLDTRDPVAVRVDNMGPLILIDNQFRSRAGASGPVVQLNGSAAGRELVSVGNQYTVPNALRTRDPKADRVLSLQDTQVVAQSISSAVPAAPTPARNHERRVFEVPPGAKAAMIQSVINFAAKSDADNPVVHLPPGTYLIDKTLVLPASRALQLVGDGERSDLKWSGPQGGTMLRLDGPSQATVRDLGFTASKTSADVAIAVNDADQAGGRVMVDRSALSAVQIEGLSSTAITMQSNNGFHGGLTVKDSASVTVVGAGNIAPINLLNGSRLWVCDSWFEGPEDALVRADRGELTWIGGHLAPADVNHGGGGKEPAILVRDFKGQMAFVGVSLWMTDRENGIRIEGDTSQASALFLGVLGNRPKYFDRRKAGGKVSFLASHRYTSGVGAASEPDVGDTGNVLQGLAQSRAINWSDARVDIRSATTRINVLSLITVDSGAIGLKIISNSAKTN